MDAVWIFLALFAGLFVLSRLVPGLGGGWGPKKQCGWTPPADSQKEKKPEDKNQDSQGQ